MKHRDPAEILNEKRHLGEAGQSIMKSAAGVGIVCLLIGIALGFVRGDHGMQFWFSYLFSFTFWLSLCIGALFFVIIQHLVKAGWSVVIRRIAEVMASNMALMAILFIPLLYPLFAGNGLIWPWTNPQAIADDTLLQGKAIYFENWFVGFRLFVYFAIWIFLSRFFLINSTKQDDSGDPKITRKLERFSPVAIILWALSMTFFAFDVLMSLEPHWYSTIYGVYFFAGSVVGFYAFVTLICMALQKIGLLKDTITVEHYHDLGKLLFAKIFFWGYIGFSQFLLIWYAAIPEETMFYKTRQENGWIAISFLLLFGHLLIPFVGMISRHAKRRLNILCFWACFMTFMHAVDIYWLIVPNKDNVHWSHYRNLGDHGDHASVVESGVAYAAEGGHEHAADAAGKAGEVAGHAHDAAQGAHDVLVGVTPGISLGAIDLFLFLGIGGLWIAGFCYMARKRPLVPEKDPRLGESLSFKNF